MNVSSLTQSQDSCKKKIMLAVKDSRKGNGKMCHSAYHVKICEKFRSVLIAGAVAAGQNGSE